ncbi:hypothetical protein SLEP1_g59979 [Rubroshorea leprosula]|uniref:Protein TAR1 n=1 Tax=Rubroshorea leprosula TaxID=152421 RepID=A0AAV5MY28_9ROSI|nr:hypothetical protein SLEP1_g59979 [Rubroshorea leprosula]
MHTRTQTFHRRSWSVDGAGTGPPTSQVTCASWVFSPPARTHVALLGPCFKTGGMEAFRQHRELAVPEGLKEQVSLPRVGGRQRQGIKPCFYPANQLDADQLPEQTTSREASISKGAPAASIPFPLNNFKYFLTLFSKFFSSFPHGTCSLSVSRQYLALDGIYHLLWAAFPSNPTL